MHGLKWPINSTRIVLSRYGEAWRVPMAGALFKDKKRGPIVHPMPVDMTRRYKITHVPERSQ